MPSAFNKRKTEFLLHPRLQFEIERRARDAHQPQRAALKFRQARHLLVFQQPLIGGGHAVQDRDAAPRPIALARPAGLYLLASRVTPPTISVIVNSEIPTICEIGRTQYCTSSAVIFRRVAVVLC